MKLPRQLISRNCNAHKNQFGHVCVIAGSRNMLGAAALTSLAVMRSGAGLVTAAVPQSLNQTIQRKINNVVMTLPLKDTVGQTLSCGAFSQIQKIYEQFDVFAIGPGLSRDPSTTRLVLKIIATSPKSLVLDADALYALTGHTDILNKINTLKILTPHVGEMARLTNQSKDDIEGDRRQIALKFAQQYNCVLLLKGHNTVVADPQGQIYINKTGNPGMATAGSGDVLTGIIAAFIAQGLSGFEAAKYGAYIHGKAGDLAAKKKTQISMIASDIIDEILNVFKREV